MHGGSCSLSKEPAAPATIKALKLGNELGKLMSLDVNYCSLMWDSDQQAATAAVM